MSECQTKEKKLLVNTDIVNHVANFLADQLSNFFIKIYTPLVVSNLNKTLQESNFPFLVQWGLVNSVVVEAAPSCKSRFNFDSCVKKNTSQVAASQ